MSPPPRKKSPSFRPDDARVPTAAVARVPAAAAAEKATLNGGVTDEEQVPITHPAPNGGGAKEEEEEEGVAGAHTAARAEIEDLGAAKLDLEAKLAEARRENKSLAGETHSIEGIFMQAREEVTIVVRRRLCREGGRHWILSARATTNEMRVQQRDPWTLGYLFERKSSSSYR